MIDALAATVLTRLRDAVGERHVVVDPQVLAGRSRDFTGRYVGTAAALVRPGSTAEVAALVAVARAEGIALVTQGGNTGLVGGSVPLHGEVIVSTERLDAIDEVDGRAGRITAGAGVTIARLHDAALGAGWAYGIDLASRDSATLGGTIATNAGGLRFVRHGGTRQQLLGIEAVLGTGAIVSRLGGLAKDNTGYDLAGLLCGSEGTLGIVTRACVRLVPEPECRAVALVGCVTVEAAVELGLALRRIVEGLEAVELFLDTGMALVRERFGLPAPLKSSPRAYLLVEVATNVDPTTSLAAALEAVAAGADTAVAVDPGRRAELWRYREGHTEAINGIGVPHKLDVTLPDGVLASFVDEIEAVVTTVVPGASVWCFGHVADGNIHVNVTGVDPHDDRVDDVVLRHVISLGGSISAEHGIGTAKLPWLAAARAPGDLAAFRAIKSALDPDRVCNPHVLS